MARSRISLHLAPREELVVSALVQPVRSAYPQQPREVYHVERGLTMCEKIEYTHLAQRDGSSYRQFFVKGRNVRAETLYRATFGSEPMTPDDVARDYDVPVKAVREAIHYCMRNAPLLQKERDEDWTQSQSDGLVAFPPVASRAGVQT
jgi:uncharacterized protein (DUF433 family)